MRWKIEYLRRPDAQPDALEVERGHAMSTSSGPGPQGLYDPQHEHESCGVGFVVDLRGRKSAKIVRNGIQILLNLQHRGASGCEVNSGDGAGILLQIPHKFFASQAN